MPTVPSNTETTTTEAPAKKRPTKKVAAKKAVKKVAKKGGTVRSPRAKKDGLRKPQVAVLKTLSKSSKPLSWAQICEKAGTDPSSATSLMGSKDPATRAANDKRKFPCLLTLKAVKLGTPDESGPTVYEITPTGRQLLAKSEA